MASSSPDATTTTTTTTTAMRSENDTPLLNLLDLASAALASTVAAAVPIRQLAEQDAHVRTKEDGSLVTDADYMAQGVIVRALRKISSKVCIVGEESEEEMQRHIQKEEEDTSSTEESVEQPQQEQDPEQPNENDWYDWAHEQVHGRHQQLTETTQQKDNDESLPEVLVDPHRVRVFVDPLDGTKSYARGDYDAVTILIAIVLDTTPYFGVICKPFGNSELPAIRTTPSVAVYGGLLLQGAFVAGREDSLLPLNQTNPSSESTSPLPRAVISSSRSTGIVLDFCRDLSSQDILHPELLHVSGAGEKSLRLVLHSSNEALWFFPKGGTSRWDVAACDALLRVLGGRVSDKFGKELDYCISSRQDSENSEGIIASNDAALHAECIKLFQEGNWAERY